MDYGNHVKGMTLYNRSMHQFIMDEIELGTRVAYGLDMEAIGFSALDDIMLQEDLEEIKGGSSSG